MNRNDFLAEIWEVDSVGGLITMCSWCNRVLINDDWIDPPPGALSTIDERMTLTHSICLDCVEAITQKGKGKGKEGEGEGEGEAS